MLFLIFDNAIAGTTTQAEGLPDGFQAIEGPNAPIENLYWDGKAIALKPPSPSPTVFWDDQTHTWQEVLATNDSPAANWEMLVASLQNTPEWGRAYAAAEQTLKANTSFTTLMSALTMQSEETLQFAIAKLREAMNEIPDLGDFSEEEIDSMNQKLKDAGLQIQL